MNKRIINILTLAFVITTFGFIMDGDVKEPSMSMRFLEFILMFGVLSLLISVIYLAINFTKRRVQKA